MSIDHLLKTNNNALLSVYDKTGIAEFAKGLHELGWNIISSGGTAKVVAEAGVPVTDVAELVGGEAILGHRVVTLSREVHSGLLADADKPEDLTESFLVFWRLTNLSSFSSYLLSAPPP
jgi:AICAR transformylase/IMP cyclohydrolase PurH